MRAGEPLRWDSSVSSPIALLKYLAELGDVLTWGLGTHFVSGWMKPLPDVLHIDAQFLKNYRGVPWLYQWNLNALDLAALGAVAGLRWSLRAALAVGSTVLTDLILSYGASVGLSKLLLPREQDEVESVFTGNNALFYLSATKIAEQGYKSFEVHDDIIILRK